MPGSNLFRHDAIVAVSSQPDNHDLFATGSLEPDALPPELLPKALAGMEALGRNGLRYPFPQYGIQQDVRDGMAASYPDRK